jgi:hypothetical protein
MKKFKITAWIFLVVVPVLFSIASCKKFLDRKPLTATLEDLNQGALEGQVLGMYTNLRNLAGFSLLPWIDMHSIRDDDAQKGSDANDGNEIVAEFDRFQYTKDDWAPNTYWNDHYTMINLANEALYTADSLNATDPASLRNIGEACFFRAYSYFELVKSYGDVPLINFPIRSAAQGIQPKSPVATIYTFIDSNLQVAAQYLPQKSEEYGEGYTGRLTRGAANTLWAQTYLFRQDWARVVALCNQVIASGEYALMPIFRISGDRKARTDRNPFLKCRHMSAQVLQPTVLSISVRIGEPANRYGVTGHRWSGTWAGAGTHLRKSL